MSELKEKIARAMRARVAFLGDVDADWEHIATARELYRLDAQAALDAIEAAGFVVVLRAVLEAARFVDDPPMSGRKRMTLSELTNVEAKN